MLRMPIRENPHSLVDRIPVRNVLVSVSDKKGLGDLVNGLIKISPDVVFYSTGGTGKAIVDALGSNAGEHYISVEDFTKLPEMDGGLVKTLHPSIHAGLLAERGNPKHLRFMEEDLPKIEAMPGVYFDVMVGGIYDFNNAVAEHGKQPEVVRGNIDIGGPTMIRAAAKNWPSVAVLIANDQYKGFIEEVNSREGVTTLDQRFELAQAAFSYLARNAKAVKDYFLGIDFNRDVLPTLNIAGN